MTTELKRNSISRKDVIVLRDWLLANKAQLEDTDRPTRAARATAELGIIVTAGNIKGVERDFNIVIGRRRGPNKPKHVGVDNSKVIAAVLLQWLAHSVSLRNLTTDTQITQLEALAK